ncbi:MAG: alpha/beta hydrolase [Myxococcota bacterium]
MIRARLGELDCVVVEEGPGPLQLAVVLCHGFGAPGDDLVPLGPELVARRPRLSGKVRFVFPCAPLSLDGFGFGDSRAWWMIDLARLTGMRAKGQSLRQEVPDGLAKARRLLLGMLETLLRQTHLSMGQVVLGGFSQGAMLATDVALRLEEPPAGLAVLSGTLLCEKEWNQRAASRRGLPVVQTHGRQDPLLPFEEAVALHELFVRNGLVAELISFDGGHTIDPSGLEKLGDFLVNRLP